MSTAAIRHTENAIHVAIKTNGRFPLAMARAHRIAAFYIERSPVCGVMPHIHDRGEDVYVTVEVDDAPARDAALVVLSAALLAVPA